MLWRITTFTSKHENTNPGARMTRLLTGFAFSDIYFNAGTWADRADLNDQMPLIRI